MYNEADIQRHKATAAEYKRQVKRWHDLAGVLFKSLLVFVILDLLMIASPAEFGRDFMLLYVGLTLIPFVGHIICVFQAKRYHAKRIVEESYIETNDYKNINNPHNKENI